MEGQNTSGRTIAHKSTESRAEARVRGCIDHRGYGSGSGSGGAITASSYSFIHFLKNCYCKEQHLLYLHHDRVCGL